MISFLTHPNDSTYIYFYGEEAKKIQEYTNKVPEYMYLPQFHGIPSPEVYIDSFQKSDKTIYYAPHGLWHDILDFCKDNNIKNNGIDPSFYRLNGPSYEEFKDIVLKYFNNIEPREYQLRAAWKIINYKRSASILCTRSGKTLINSIVLRYLMETGFIHKILMIVPSIHLVKQGVSDINEYFSFFNMQEVWAGAKDCMTTSNFIISTFQSAVKKDSNFFKGVDCVVIDECHKTKCKSIKKILQSPFMKKVKICYGVTGTLPKKGSLDYFANISLTGPIIQTLQASSLVDDNILAKPVIKQYRIEHDVSDEEIIKYAEYLCGNYVIIDGKKVESGDALMRYKKTLPVALEMVRHRADYKDILLDTCKNLGAGLLNLENMLIQNDNIRIKLLDDIIINNGGNTIIFCHNIEYINRVYKHLKNTFKNKNIMKITGSTNLKERQKKLDMMLESDDCILIGSYGVVSTGLTFKNVDNGILFQSFKSDIINRQSMGRLMLRSENKTEFKLFDIIDIYPTKRLYKQGIEKCRTWKEDNWNYIIETYG